MTTIVIPMAGASHRFFEAGFTQPKYMLPLWGETVFSHAIGSFRRYFNSHRFCFIVRQQLSAIEFVQSEADRLGILTYDVVSLSHPTRGQADTALLGLRQSATAPEEPVTIFNIDTFRPGFRYPVLPDAHPDTCFLEAFLGGGDNCSFVEPIPGTDSVMRTAEKQRISDLCSTGLYHFSEHRQFAAAVDAEARLPSQALPEAYIAPVYNHLIKRGIDVRYVLIPSDEIVVCGTPDAYHELLGRVPPSPAVQRGLA
ncbi:MAG: capsular biosynthesis protein [Myxococcales bacterium FL481]|nr:MAG: capsular biosynthesis protein [Myxococcales bacterium FL481]